MLKFYGIYRSPAYRDWVRRQACAICSCVAEHAHHEPLGENYVGGKPPDSHSIPLCAICHEIRHRQGVEWIEKMINPERVIIKLLTRYIRELEANNGRKIR